MRTLLDTTLKNGHWMGHLVRGKGKEEIEAGSLR